MRRTGFNTEVVAGSALGGNLGRQRIYSSAAERQQAFRDRAKANALRARPGQAKFRKSSRPQRLAALCAEAQALLEEYEDWLERIPESLQNTSQASALAEAVEALTTVTELLGDLVVPRGFGRD